jgi:hypothetical protein
MGNIVESNFPFIEPGGLQKGVVNPTAVPSAAAMPAPTAKVSFVSGVAAITTIKAPWPGFTGSIKYIPTGVFTGATGGVFVGVTGGASVGPDIPIAIAFTAVVSKVLELTTDGNLWYPSYLS